MNSILTLSCLAAGTLAGLLVDGLVHAPKKGTRLTRTFEQVIELTLEDFQVEVKVNGEEQEAEAPDVEVKIRQVENLTIVDEISASDEGGIQGFVRTFESLEHTETQEVSAEDEARESIEESKLEGRKVRFTLEDGEWAKAFADEEEADADLLEDLEADGGFAFLLPKEGTAVGEEWELDEQAFLLIGEPFGDLSFVGEDENEERAEQFSQQFEENLDLKEFNCKLESIEEGLATIKLVIEASTEVEVEDEVPEEAREAGLEASSKMAFGFELTGTLVWDLEARHIQSLDVEGGTTFEIEGVQALEGDEMSFEARTTQTFQGTLTWKAKAE